MAEVPLLHEWGHRVFGSSKFGHERSTVLRGEGSKVAQAHDATRGQRLIKRRQEERTSQSRVRRRGAMTDNVQSRISSASGSAQEDGSGVVTWSEMTSARSTEGAGPKASEFQKAGRGVGAAATPDASHGPGSGSAPDDGIPRSKSMWEKSEGGPAPKASDSKKFGRGAPDGGAATTPDALHCPGGGSAPEGGSDGFAKWKSMSAESSGGPGSGASESKKDFHRACGSGAAEAGAVKTPDKEGWPEEGAWSWAMGGCDQGATGGSRRGLRGGGWPALRWALLALVVLAAATGRAEAEPQPTIGMLGRAVQRWFRDGIRTVVGAPDMAGSASVQDEASRHADVRERVRLMIEERLKGKLGEEAEARADPLPSFRPGPTTELIGRFVANAISALQKPDGIVSLMRQKVGFVTANFRLSCYVCEMGVGLVRQFVYANKTLEEVADTLGNVCNLMTVTSERVCHGFLNEFLPEIMYVMNNIELLDEEVCGFVLGGNCVGRTYLDAFGWDVNIPMRTHVQQDTIFRRKPYANKLKVLHITDVHIDEDYVEGSVVDCGEPLCCREKKRGYGIAQHRAGKWGSTGRCDTPERTIDSLLDHLKEHHQFDYIMWTGDVPAHNIWQQSRDDNLFMMKRFNQKLKSYFPDTPIFPSVGNHESHPANSFPQPYIEGPFAIDYLYQALNTSWSHLVPGNISETVLRGGFYSVLVKPGFRIISLNSNYCHNKNWWMLLDSKDPAGQLQWLVEELEMAEQNEEKVHIIGHIPPGSVDCAYVWSDNFNSIINRYQDTVSAQFYGHNHMDEFEIFYDKDDPSIPINMAYVGPSVSPYDGVNPAYKIYYVDGDYEGSPREVTDYETYFLDLETANANDLPTWDILYSAKDAFGLRSLEPAEWHRLVGKMASNSDLFREFYRYMYRRANKKGCSGVCKQLTLCRLKKAWAGASKDC